MWINLELNVFCRIEDLNVITSSIIQEWIGPLNVKKEVNKFTLLNKVLKKT